MSDNYLKYLKYKSKYTKLLINIGSGLNTLPIKKTISSTSTSLMDIHPALIFLMSEYEPSLSLLETNKQLLIDFFKIYKSSILDIENINQMIDNDFPDNFFKNIGMYKFVKELGCKLYFIEKNIKLLFKELQILFVENTEVLPLLNEHLAKYKIPVSLFIIYPTSIELINKLLKDGIPLKLIYKLLALYKSDRELINRLLVDKSLHEITAYGDKLIQLYNSDRELINRLLTANISLHKITASVNK